MNQNENFFALTPDRILDAVEASLSHQFRQRATGRTWVLNSVENRVYEIEFEDQSRVIAKFYRPGRWSAEQILEEHAFLQKLDEAEVPVVKPYTLQQSTTQKIVGPTLGLLSEGIFFTVFPKISGRSFDELDLEQLRHLGRFIARLHNIGESFKAKHRLKLSPQSYGRAALDFLVKSRFLDEHMRPRYEPVARSLIEKISPLFERLQVHAIHGDCHLANIMWYEDKPIFVDFDDMVIGPAVQDIWMMLNGRDEEELRKRDLMIEAYEIFRPFDRNQLQLIEPLRALRLIHYAAWIAKRWEDPSFPRMFPHFASNKYWFEEIQALQEVEAQL